MDLATVRGITLLGSRLSGVSTVREITPFIRGVINFTGQSQGSTFVAILGCHTIFFLIFNNYVDIITSVFVSWDVSLTKTVTSFLSLFVVTLFSVFYTIQKQILPALVINCMMQVLPCTMQPNTHNLSSDLT